MFLVMQQWTWATIVHHDTGFHPIFVFYFDFQSKKGIIAKLLFPVKKSYTFTSILKVKLYS